MAAASPQYAPVSLAIGAVVAAGVVIAVALLLTEDLFPPGVRNLVMGVALGSAITGAIALCNLSFRRRR